jgi:hypothetical protein
MSAQIAFIVEERRTRLLSLYRRGIERPEELAKLLNSTIHVVRNDLRALRHQTHFPV